MLRGALLAVIALHTLVVAIGLGIIAWQVGAHHSQLRRDGSGQGRIHAVTLDDLMALSPSQFEGWVQGLFQDRGYFVHNTPTIADHGIDLWLVTPAGERVVVQCKRYGGTVGEPVVRDLYGVMQHEEASRGFLVTTGRFSEAAREWAQGKPIDLIDGPQLVRMSEPRPDLAGAALDPAVAEIGLQ